MVSARQYHNVCSMVSARTGLLVLPELEQLTFFFASRCFIFSHFPLALLGARFSREENLVRGQSQHPQHAGQLVSGPKTFQVPRLLFAISLVQFSSRCYLCAQISPYALHLVFQKFPQLCLCNNFRLGVKHQVIIMISLCNSSSTDWV